MALNHLIGSQLVTNQGVSVSSAAVPLLGTAPRVGGQGEESGDEKGSNVNVPGVQLKDSWRLNDLVKTLDSVTARTKL